MKKFHGYILSLLILPIAIVPIAASSPGIALIWNKGTITVTGSASVYLDASGTPSDELSGQPISLNRARHLASLRAREKAIEQTMKAIMGIRLDGAATIGEAATEDEYLATRILDTVNRYGNCVISPKGFAGVSCSISLKISELIPAFPFTFPAEDLPLASDQAVPTDYTSLIIDARGIGVHPMLFPSILSEEGKEIFSRHNIHASYALKNGMVSYVYTDREAETHRRRGDKPYFTIALRSLDGNPVLANRDIRKIYSSRSTREQLQRCNIIMIIDR